MSQDNLKSIVIAEKPDLNFKSDDGTLIRVLSEEDERYLEEKYNEMVNFMRDNHNQDHAPEVKDELYHQLQVMWNEVSGKNGGKLNDISFNLILNRSEHKYLLDTLRNKGEYNSDTIFYALELEIMIDSMTDNDKYVSDVEAKPFPMTAVDIHYLYHILSSITVKGLGKGSKNFAEIIRRIALSSTVYNHYKQNFENLAKAVQLWTASLEPGTAIKEGDPIYQLIWGDSDTKPVLRESADSAEEAKIEEVSEDVSN